MDQSKLLYLMNDFVIQEHVCNLRCNYCLNFENELKGTEPWVPLERIDLNLGSKGFVRAHQVLEICRQQAQAPILRISGGEILAIAGGIEFIEQVAPDWEKVQILTNATLLFGETLERLSRIPSLNLCCSVDGHTEELNALRTKHAAWARRIIDGLLGAVEVGIPVEVNTVLTRHNVEALYDFAKFLFALPKKADLRLLPFPVRGEVAKRLAVLPGQTGSLHKLLDSYEELAPILPPRAYLTRLLDFYEQGRRAFRCRIPLTYLQTFDDGIVASCTNCWAVSLGSLLEGDEALRQVGQANIHKIFLRPRPRISFCQGCFTPFDLVNLYFDDECSIDELSSMDIYSDSRVRERLELLKPALISDRPRAVWT